LAKENELNRIFTDYYENNMTQYSFSDALHVLTNKGEYLPYIHNTIGALALAMASSKLISFTVLLRLL